MPDCDGDRAAGEPDVMTVTTTSDRHSRRRSSSRGGERRRLSSSQTVSPPTTTEPIDATNQGECKTNGNSGINTFLSHVELGSASPDDELACPPYRAVELILALRVHDFAFVLRSDGRWTYAIIAERTAKNMRFVVDSDGATKTFRRREWLKCIRLVGNFANKEWCRRASDGCTSRSRSRPAIKRSSSLKLQRRYSSDGAEALDIDSRAVRRRSTSAPRPKYKRSDSIDSLLKAFQLLPTMNEDEPSEQKMERKHVTWENERVQERSSTVVREKQAAPEAGDDASCSKSATGDRVFNSVTAVAPQGKLGIVISNPSHGLELPIVHRIMSGSALEGMVHKGDLLLSIDEVDCRGMTAAAVSLLMRRRSEEPERKLALLREQRESKGQSRRLHS